MILQVCVVYDSKARAFLLPTFFSHVDLARRAFADAANEPTHGISKNPEDFTLFHVGTWDDGTGEFDSTGPFGPHINLGLASAYKRDTAHQTYLNDQNEFLKRR